MSNTIAFPLLFATTLVACGTPDQPDRITSTEKYLNPCSQNDPDVAHEVSVYIERLKDTSSIEEAEDIGTALGSLFESDACSFLLEATRAELQPPLIAELIGALPHKLADVHCERESRLRSRLVLLRNLSRDTPNVGDVERIVEKYADLEGVACTESAR